MNKSNTKIQKISKLDSRNLIIGLFSLLLLAVLGYLATILLEFNKQESLILAFSLLGFYAALMFILASKKTIILVKKQETETKILEKIIEKPIIKEIIKEIKTPIQTIKVVKQSPKKLNIPKYNYLGSTINKTFHSRNCRLGKLIKKKYKLSNNSKSFFIKRKFKPCKVCILKEKKI